MKVSVWAGICVAVMAASVACSSNNGENSSGNAENVSSVSASVNTSAARPTITDPKVQPPSQDNNQYSNGMPKVLFDPCTWISDEAIQKAGFDPSSRHRVTDFVAEQTWLTCGFKSKLRDLTVNSGNVPWEQDLQKHASRTTAVTVNGREGIWVNDQQFKGACELDLRTKVGFVQINTDLTDETDSNETPPCDDMLTTATIIEAEIGKGN